MVLLRRKSLLAIAVSLLTAGLGAAELKTSTLRNAAQGSGKISPALQDRIAKSGGPIDVIVLLWEQEVTRPSLAVHAFEENRAAYYAESERTVDQVISAVPGMVVGHRYRSLAGFAAQVSASQIDQLAAQPEVQRIVPDLEATLYRREGNQLMKVGAVHARGVRGAGVSVAVIDDGVDYTHPELGGGGFPNSVVTAGFDFQFLVDDPSPVGTDSHGTSVAGIIAGRGDAATGAGGVAPEAKIVGLRVGGESLPASNIIAALDWSVTHQNQVSPPIRIVNMSLGFDTLGYFTEHCDGNPDVAPFKSAIDRLTAAGILAVAAVGNEAKLGTSLPSCLSKVISVGAVYDAAFGSATFENCTDPSTAADQVTCYSNSAAFIDLLAPSHLARTPRSGGGYDDQFGGTSASAPYASGALALLMSAYPGRPIDQYRSVLKATGQPVEDPFTHITTPRVDADAAWIAMSDGGAAKPFVYYLLGAARAQGNNNTFFQSDVRVANLGAQAASVDAFLLPNPDNSGTVPSASFQVAAGQVASFNDALSSMFGLASGLGAVAFASTQPLVVTSDLYTTNNVCPEFGGTLGQFIPAFAPDQASTRQRIYNVIHDARFRANFGVVNVGNAQATATVRIFDGSGALRGQKDYGLGPFGWRQINRIFSDMGAGTSSNATIQIVSNIPVLTYVSVVDEKTGDPFLVWGIPE